MKTDRSNFFVKLAILTVICFCILNIVKLQMQYNGLKEQAAQLEIEKEKYENSIDQINTELNSEFNNEYVMRIAREKLNYYLPDEIIFYNDK